MKIGFIGSGNMGGAIIKAVAGKSSHDLYVYDKDQGKVNALVTGCGIKATQSIAAVVIECDVIFICVKPNVISTVLEAIKNVSCYADKTYVSIAAGVKVNVFTDILGSVHLVRTMPNLPAMVGEGFTVAYFHNMEDKMSLKDELMSLFKMFGKAICVDSEKYVDKCISVTSSSPAYICMVIEAMADGAVACGLPRQKALEYAANTLAGAAQMYLSTGMHPGELKDAVCSPGGSTIAGVKALEANGFRGAVMECIQAAYKRNKELG